MLVLSRKAGEKIHIGDNITVEIRRVAGNRVALAFDAPADVRILRGELQAFDDGFGSRASEPVKTDDTQHLLEFRLHRASAS